MSIPICILAVLALLGGSAFFSAAEMAISAANRMRLASAAEEGSRKAKTALAVLDRFEARKAAAPAFPGPSSSPAACLK